MDAVTAVSGSGPAYVFLFVEQWINAAVKLGLTRSKPNNWFIKPYLAVLIYWRKANLTRRIAAKVTSKGGTTQAAMDVFSKGKFDQLMKDALLQQKSGLKNWQNSGR